MSRPRYIITFAYPSLGASHIFFTMKSAYDHYKLKQSRDERTGISVRQFQNWLKEQRVVEVKYGRGVGSYQLRLLSGSTLQNLHGVNSRLLESHDLTF